MTKLEQLRGSVATLAAPAEKQIEHLSKIMSLNKSYKINDLANIDELALEFEDAIYATNEYFRSEAFSRSAIEALHNLDKELERFGGSQAGHFWTVGALRYDMRWNNIRELAAKCLSILPVKL